MWADLIENGEVKIVAPIKGATGFGYIWTDETREEAQHPKNQEILQKVKALVKEGTYRIVA